jgi:hypothetical protein
MLGVKVEGKLEGILEIAHAMKIKGMDISTITELMGLSTLESAKV